MNPPTLKFDRVTTEPDPRYETALWEISFELNPGELLLIRTEGEDERLPLADAIEGLVSPAAGTVTFLGEDWQAMSADHAASRRSRIGRLFEAESWVSDLEIDQNLMLAQLHHTRRSETEILAEILELARLFGLPGLPRGRPGDIRQWDLRKAGCIRAFLGKPLLIILEQPAHDLYVQLRSPLLSAVHAARQRGGAVLWTVSESQTWNHPAIGANRRARMVGGQLHLLEKEA